MEQFNSKMDLSHIWQFSASSQLQLEALQQCIATKNIDLNNKWVQKFYKPDPVVINITEECSENTEDLEAMDTEVIQIPEEKVEDNLEDFYYEVEQDPIRHFDKIVNMCLRDTKIYSLLTNNLSNTCIEKLCNHIFKTTDLNLLFLDNFYKLFLSEFLKKEHSSLSLDLLIKAKTSHGIQFKILINLLLNEKENILQEFVSTLNANEQTDFINNVVDIDLPHDVFVYKMHTIYLAYKDCQKSVHIQNYFFSKLSQVAQTCVLDKGYGRLLLTFLQAERDSKRNTDELEKLVEPHKSVFKRSCLKVLECMKNYS